MRLRVRGKREREESDANPYSKKARYAARNKAERNASIPVITVGSDERTYKEVSHDERCRTALMSRAKPSSARTDANGAPLTRFLCFSSTCTTAIVASPTERGARPLSSQRSSSLGSFGPRWPSLGA